MPLPLAVVFRAALLVLMAGYVFLMYCLARTLSGTFGLRLETVALASLAALALGIPLLWIVGLPELPEIYAKHWRANRRWQRNECPDCGYALRGGAEGNCPECGRATAAPEPYRFGRATLRRFALMFLSAWLMGSLAGEAWTRADEIAFQREAETAMSASASDQYSRPRRWPSAGPPMAYVRGQGVLIPPKLGPKPHS